MDGRTATDTIPSLKSEETLDLHEPPEKGTTKFHGYKSCGNNTCCCSGKGVALAKGGGGRSRILMSQWARCWSSCQPSWSANTCLWCRRMLPFALQTVEQGNGAAGLGPIRSGRTCSSLCFSSTNEMRCRTLSPLRGAAVALCGEAAAATAKRPRLPDFLQRKGGQHQRL